jgi:phenylacetyl-CoA:acceptor oxidoreductase subunit 2
MNWLQRHWDARAAANFILGGAGSGLLACSFLLQDRLSVFVGLGLIAAGLTAVWLETGRKLRAINVFFNPFTSWMTRESFAALLLFILGASFLVFQDRRLIYGVALMAAVFLFCQARILHASKGIPAWRAPQVVPLIVFTGLAEGSGLALLFSTNSVVLAVFVLAVLARVIAWLFYDTQVKSGALEMPGQALLWGGTIAALVLLPFAPPLAGLVALAAGWWLKFALVTRASFNQGYSLPHLPVRGTR